MIAKMDNLPFPIIEQMIQCFGRCFHYKDNLEAFLISAGVSQRIASKYKDEYKFVWGKKMLSELGETEEGKILQRKILRAFHDLRNLPDSSLTGNERNIGLDTLRRLKELIIEYKLIEDEKRNTIIDRKRITKEKVKIQEERYKKLEELRCLFNKGLISPDRQASGYTLEKILQQLFSLSEIEYTNSYKTETQQIDGFFHFEGFDYLVEAKWRKDQPNESEIAAFKHKTETKLDSTRGLFVSINGFRPEVVQQFNGGTNIVLMCGIDLTNILEGRIGLREILEIKIKKAAQYGICYYSSNEYFK